MENEVGQCFGDTNIPFILNMPGVRVLQHPTGQAV